MADIDWNLNKERSGLDWARKNDYKDFLPLNDLISPELIQARLLIESDSADDIRECPANIGHARGILYTS